MQTLETDRLILRPFCQNDLDFLDYLHGDMDVMRYTLGRVRTHEENKAYLDLVMQLHEQDGTGPYMVIRKSDNHPLGRCGFSHFYGYEKDGADYFYWETIYNGPEDERKKSKLEIGYSFTKESWGHGYATEAALRVRDHGFGDRRYTSLCSLIMKENTASRNVAERLGFNLQGEMFIHDQPALEYGMTLDHWVQEN
ncbi:GNAT family N-acetyltransferase [Emcibacter sp.]|uniref:GNAT family N-acetyltransferase n=1 Tax=Emcibacter sp. TaxID=1979954 RepID=UPI003A90409A